MNTIDRTSILRDLIQTNYGGNQSLFAIATGKKVARKYIAFVLIYLAFAIDNI